MSREATRDHGGNIDAAIARFGGDDWVDLSTGINRISYPLPRLTTSAWAILPTRAGMQQLCDAASRAYATSAAILPLAGAQAAIQLIPRLVRPGMARVLGPTYNEHAAALHIAGWQVQQVARFDELAGADLAVVVNPNNPDGAVYAPEALLALARLVGTLVVDESFADATPGMSLAPTAGQKGLFVLRSFGKFYGLAGVRLGFAIGHGADISALEAMAGPWQISGPAIEIGSAALADADWQLASSHRLAEAALRMDGIAIAAGWSVVGGTALFRLYETPDDSAVQVRLAHARIWSRIFPYSRRWLRLGLPGHEAEWQRLATALAL